MTIQQIKIYDMDGTIVDSTHRYRTDETGKRIDLSFWRANDIPSQIAKDSLLPLAEAYKADLLNPSIYVIIATARACFVGDANYHFIDKHLGKPNMFIHRGLDDNRGGAELKLQAIKPLLNLKQFKGAVVHVFEDNKSYLSKMSESLKAHTHYVSSLQGH